MNTALPGDSDSRHKYGIPTWIGRWNLRTSSWHIWLRDINWHHTVNKMREMHSTAILIYILLYIQNTQNTGTPESLSINHTGISCEWLLNFHKKSINSQAIALRFQHSLCYHMHSSVHDTHQWSIISYKESYTLQPNYAQVLLTLSNLMDEWEKFIYIVPVQ